MRRRLVRVRVRVWVRVRARARARVRVWVWVWVRVRVERRGGAALDEREAGVAGGAELLCERERRRLHRLRA